MTMHDFDQPLDFDRLVLAGWHCLSELAEVQRLADLADRHVDALASMLEARMQAGASPETMQSIADDLHAAQNAAFWHHQDVRVWEDMIDRNRWRLAAARAEKHGRTH